MFGMKNRPATPPQDKPAAGKAAKPQQVAVTVHMTPQQRDKFALLGGEAWLREQVDAARFESVFKA